MSDKQIFLWPNSAPGSEHLSLSEEIAERSESPDQFRDRAISAIGKPSMTVFRPTNANGMAMLIAPGGGYQRIVVDKEGEEIAAWLTSLGITTFVLRYRLPAEGHHDGREVPLQDKQRAMRLIRANALRFGMSPARVGAMGFSAGGHVVSSLATRFAAKIYPRHDEADDNSARPDFIVLGYPVITMLGDLAHAGSREKLLGQASGEDVAKFYSNEFQVSPDMPPAFIVLPDDDASVPAENGVRFYLGMRKVGVPAELHVFQKGGHGFGIRQAVGPVRAWTDLCEQWLRSNGWL